MNQDVHNCHWSVPTLLMPRPFWFAAGDSTWCCWDDHKVRILNSTEACATCALWKPREIEQAHEGAIPPRGAAPLPANPTPEDR